MSALLAKVLRLVVDDLLLSSFRHLMLHMGTLLLFKRLVPLLEP